MSLLEVIAQTEADAEAAEAGGADRIEVVADMTCRRAVARPSYRRRGCAGSRRCRCASCCGPRPGSVRPARSSTGCGGRRPSTPRRARTVSCSASSPRHGAVDTAATSTLAAAVAPLPWTFHRAMDNAACPDAAWLASATLPGLDAVLSAGSARGVEVGMEVLLRRAASRGVADGRGRRRCGASTWRCSPPPGSDAFHVGAAVRRQGVVGAGTGGRRAGPRVAGAGRRVTVRLSGLTAVSPATPSPHLATELSGSGIRFAHAGSCGERRAWAGGRARRRRRRSRRVRVPGRSDPVHRLRRPRAGHLRRAVRPAERRHVHLAAYPEALRRGPGVLRSRCGVRWTASRARTSRRRSAASTRRCSARCRLPPTSRTATSTSRTCGRRTSATATGCSTARRPRSAAGGSASSAAACAPATALRTRSTTRPTPRRSRRVGAGRRAVLPHPAGRARTAL